MSLAVLTLHIFVLQACAWGSCADQVSHLLPLTPPPHIPASSLLPLTLPPHTPACAGPCHCAFIAISNLAGLACCTSAGALEFFCPGFFGYAW